MSELMAFNRRNYNSVISGALLSVNGNLSPEDLARIESIRTAWNFYDGFHWENITDTDRPQITHNYCRSFINKFVAFEFGKGFVVEPHAEAAEFEIDDEGRNTFDYLDDVWDDNLRETLCLEIGQMKAITGDAWVQVRYSTPDEIDDPYEKYPNGRIRIMVIPTHVAFPFYDQHDKDKLIKLIIQYPIDREEENFFGSSKVQKIIYQQEWTKDRIIIKEGEAVVLNIENKYGIIPFIQMKNYTVAGRSEGLGDLEDLIPLNVELNTKVSDISEIIEYHAAPITIVFGAKISNLEKGVNKVWGGLPKDAKVQNLALESDLTAAVNYIDELKQTMYEVGGVPEGALGGTQSISNTSGVALQFVNMPIIERTRVKRLGSKVGLEQVNALILLISLKEGLVSRPEKMKPAVFYHNEVSLPDTLPKDNIIELQQIGEEMNLGLEDRMGAMKRLNKENIETKIKAIDKDRKEHEEIYMSSKEKQLNSGLKNGESSIEATRKEIKGSNKAGKV